MGKVVVLVWLCAYAYLTHQYAQLWVHPLPLWEHAAKIAPLKPRPWLHVGIGLVLAGRWDEADAAFVRAADVAMLPHVSTQDRIITNDIAGQNRIALRRLVNAR